MKSLLLKTAVASAAAFGVMAVSVPSAFSQEICPAEEWHDDARPDHRRIPPMDEAGPARGDAHFGAEREPGMLGLAAKLSAAEIYVGITPGQLGPWRSYASALVALADMGPPQTREGRGDPTAQTGEPAPTGDRPAPALPGEQLATELLAAAEKAAALKSAVAALAATLSAEQQRRLGRMQHVLLPPQPQGPGPDVVLRKVRLPGEQRP